MKKIFSICLIILLLFGLAVTVYATEETQEEFYEDETFLTEEPLIETEEYDNIYDALEETEEIEVVTPSTVYVVAPSEIITGHDHEQSVVTPAVTEDTSVDLMDLLPAIVFLGGGLLLTVMGIILIATRKKNT